MDIYTLISKIFESLSWPVATIILALVLRGPIAKLLTTYRALRFKYKDFEINLERSIENVSKQTNEIASVEKIVLEAPKYSRQMELAKLSPRGAILESWLELEELIYDIGVEVKIAPTRPGGIYGKIVKKPLHEVIDELQNMNILDSRLLALMKELQTSRNQAVHATDFDFNILTVERFIKSTQDLMSLIKQSANQRIQRTRQEAPRP
jgi:hypothetical protein